MLLCLHKALDEVRAEHRLFNLHTGQGDEWGAEGHHRIVAFFVVENHSMRRQVNPSRLLSPELLPVLTVEVHVDIVTEQQDAGMGFRKGLVGRFMEQSRRRLFYRFMDKLFT